MAVEWAGNIRQLNKSSNYVQPWVRQRQSPFSKESLGSTSSAHENKTVSKQYKNIALYFIHFK